WIGGMVRGRYAVVVVFAVVFDRGPVDRLSRRRVRGRSTAGHGDNGAGQEDEREPTGRPARLRCEPGDEGRNADARDEHEAGRGAPVGKVGGRSRMAPVHRCREMRMEGFHPRRLRAGPFYSGVTACGGASTMRAAVSVAS